MTTSSVSSDRSKLKNDEKLSIHISFVLRHGLDQLGFVRDAQGWITVDDLLRKSAEQGVVFTRVDLERVIATNTKQRFALSLDGLRIRAHQGHSVKVDLGWPDVTPPAVLFHGTATRFLDGIRAHGLLTQERHAVHLSPDVRTAVGVGERHGKVVVLEVNAGAMALAGHRFQRTDNNVWLTAHVPAVFLSVHPAFLEEGKGTA